MTVTPAPSPISNTAPLTGQALLERYQALKTTGLSHGDIAVECGYYITIEEGVKKGEIRASSAKLNAALLRANGIDVPEKPSRGGGGGGGGWTKAVINKAGRANLPKAMVDRMNPQPGDYLELVEANEGGIALKMVRASQPSPVLVTV